MPPERAARQRRHVRRSRARQILGRALDIEEPLREAADFVLALRQIGHGMIAMNDEEGRAVGAVACAAAERLDRLHDALIALLRAARRRG
jgi:hypothetical protein